MRKQITNALLALVLPAAALADITDMTLTIPVGQQVNLETGAVVSSGGDLKWDGLLLTPQGSARVVGLGAGDAQYQSTTLVVLQQLQSIGLLLPGVSYAVGVLTNQPLAAALTNAGHLAKIEVTSSTATNGQPLPIKFTTYGASGSGGGPSTPTISAVQNNYGQIPAGLPNYGIAPSSLFFITGSALAGVTTSLQSSASPGLQTTLSGVTVTVNVGGATVNCPLYYLSPSQIDAVLPGNTPAGTGTIVVSNNGTKSTAAPILVVPSAFGVLSYSGTLAATYDASNALITATNAANPGQTIVIYGSGVGANPKDDDKVFPQNTDNLTNIPIQAYVGGLLANVLFRGRTQFPGVDQINITIPTGVPVGCYVSLAIVSGSGSSAIVSNGTTIPVAASGKTCTEPSSPFSSSLLQTLRGQTTVRTGFLTASQFTTIGAGNGNTTINALAGLFQSVTGTGFATKAGLNSVSTGSCLVNVSPSAFTVTSNFLDAGPTINVSGPQGSLALTPLSSPLLPIKLYSASSVPNNFIPAAGGPFTFDNVSGGVDVGHFNTTTTFPANFNWTNPSVVSTIDRTAGATVTWSGGTPGVIVVITGSSSTQVNGQNVSGTFSCQAPLSAGQFTIPPPVLLALPAGAGSLSLNDSTNPQIFTATGLDVGYAISSASLSENVRYN